MTDNKGRKEDVYSVDTVSKDSKRQLFPNTVPLSADAPTSGGNDSVPTRYSHHSLGDASVFREHAGDSNLGTDSASRLAVIFNAGKALSNEEPSVAIEKLGSMGAVIITISVILIVQFRGLISASVRGGRLVERLTHLIEFLSSRFYHVADILSTLRMMLPAYSGIYDDDSIGLGMTESDDFDAGGVSARRGRGGRRRRGGLGSSSIPGLEIVPESSGEELGVTAENDDTDIAKNMQPCNFCGMSHQRGEKGLLNGGYCHHIEPAFSHEEAYPSDWLVYDCKYGILTKTVGDEKARSRSYRHSKTDEREQES